MITLEQFFKQFDMMQLNEMPNIMLSPVNARYIENKLLKPIRDGLSKREFVKVTDDIYVYPVSKKESVYCYLEGINIIAACSVKFVRFCNKDFAQIVITKKYLEHHSNVMIKLYKAINHDCKMPVLSDSIQTLDSSSVYKKWHADKPKYGIKNMNAFDVVSCSSKAFEEAYDIDNKAKENILIFIEFF